MGKACHPERVSNFRGHAGPLISTSRATATRLHEVGRSIVGMLPAVRSPRYTWPGISGFCKPHFPPARVDVPALEISAERQRLELLFIGRSKRADLVFISERA